MPFKMEPLVQPNEDDKAHVAGLVHDKLQMAVEAKYAARRGDNIPVYRTQGEEEMYQQGKADALRQVWIVVNGWYVPPKNAPRPIPIDSRTGDAWFPEDQVELERRRQQAIGGNDGDALQR